MRIETFQVKVLFRLLLHGLGRLYQLERYFFLFFYSTIINFISCNRAITFPKIVFISFLFFFFEGSLSINIIRHNLFIYMAPHNLNQNFFY